MPVHRAQERACRGVVVNDLSLAVHGIGGRYNPVNIRVREQPVVRIPGISSQRRPCIKQRIPIRIIGRCYKLSGRLHGQHKLIRRVVRVRRQLPAARLQQPIPKAVITISDVVL